MKLFATAAATILLVSQAAAGTYETRCETVSVPYQATKKGGASPGRIAGGAVIGGVVGKVVTKKDSGAVAGAVIGGVVANETNKQTVTRYKEVETCTKVFVPERIADEEQLRAVLIDLNEGRSVSKEMTMDAQFTLGVPHDGKWGPKSRLAAEKYLANVEVDEPMYSLVVNDVVIVSTADVAVIEDIRSALAEAGVESQIFIDLQ